jgi:hypothetical protein
LRQAASIASDQQATLTRQGKRLDRTNDYQWVVRRNRFSITVQEQPNVTAAVRRQAFIVGPFAVSFA